MSSLEQLQAVSMELKQTEAPKVVFSTVYISIGEVGSIHYMKGESYQKITALSVEKPA
jgi:hypothetical protein